MQCVSLLLILYLISTARINLVDHGTVITVVESLTPLLGFLYVIIAFSVLTCFCIHLYVALRHSKKIRSYFGDEDEQKIESDVHPMDTKILPEIKFNEGTNLPGKVTFNEATLPPLPIKHPREISQHSDKNLLDMNQLDKNQLDSNQLDKHVRKHPDYDQMKELSLATNINKVDKTVREMPSRSEELSLAPNIKMLDKKCYVKSITSYRVAI